MVTIDTPSHVETYTTDVAFNVGFTRSVCMPRDRNEPGLLQGGAFGLPTVWLRLEHCLTEDCTRTEVRYIYKLSSFYSLPATRVSVPCRLWSWPGTYRVQVGAEVTAVHLNNSLVATGPAITVSWSTDYRVVARHDDLRHCLPGETVVVEIDYPRCIGTQDKIRLYREPRRPGLGRARYLGEQRVVPGDKAVLFPCAQLNTTHDGFDFCFHYVSSSDTGQVSLVTDSCPDKPTGKLLARIMCMTMNKRQNAPLS